MILLLLIILIITGIFTYAIYKAKNKKIAYIIKSIGYVFLFILIGWNVIYDLTRSMVDGGKYLLLQEKLQVIWVYLGILSNHVSSENNDRLLESYNRLSLHLSNFESSGTYVKEQFDFAKLTQAILTILATALVAAGKLCDLIRKIKEES